MAFGFKVSSLAALVATVCAPIFAFFMMPHASWAWATVFIAALVLYRHKAILKNLIQGKESKIGDKAENLKNVDTINKGRLKVYFQTAFCSFIHA